MSNTYTITDKDFDDYRNYFNNPGGLPLATEAEFNTVNFNYLTVARNIRKEVEYDNSGGAFGDYLITIPHGIGRRTDFYGRYRVYNPGYTTVQDKWNDWQMFPTETFPSIIGRGGMFVKNNKETELILYYNPGLGFQQRLDFDIYFLEFGFDE